MLDPATKPDTVGGKSCDDCRWRKLKCAECSDDLSKWEQKAT
jgi:hypothetical protein